MFLSHCVRALRTWQRYRAGVRELSRLSDRELADIGFSRSDITWVALQAAKDPDWRKAAAPGGDAATGR
jgi:uncharacterized protein YjiS (DUF1127 family)